MPFYTLGGVAYVDNAGTETSRRSYIDHEKISVNQSIHRTGRITAVNFRP
jgi:hypothetical protein